MSNKRHIPQQKPQQIKINLNELDRVECAECEGQHFDLVWVLHKVPAMVSQTGKESIFPVAYFRCIDCLNLTNIIHGK